MGVLQGHWGRHCVADVSCIIRCEYLHRLRWEPRKHWLPGGLANLLVTHQWNNYSYSMFFLICLDWRFVVLWSTSSLTNSFGDVCSVTKFVQHLWRSIEEAKYTYPRTSPVEKCNRKPNWQLSNIVFVTFFTGICFQRATYILVRTFIFS